MTSEPPRAFRRDVIRQLGLLGAVGVAGTSTWCYPASATTNGSFARSDRTIESFDGTDLETTLYTPDSDDGPYPAVLVTHGWASTRNSDAVTTLARTYASNGYVVLTYDSRGFGDSGGLVGVAGENEIRDARRLISWLASREEVETDGRDDPVVGMDGFSYAAGIQLRTAAVDDRLDAIVPRWAWHDLRFSQDPNGVVKWPWTYGLYVSGLRASAGGDGTPDLDPTFLELAREAIGEGEASSALREFWASRSPGPQGELAGIETPTLLIHGWHDRLFTPNEAIANYRGLSLSDGEVRLLMYDGGHDFLGAPGDGDEYQLRFLTGATLGWFERHLKGNDVPLDERLAPVTLYRERTGAFESFEQLPAGRRTLSLRRSAGRGETTLTTDGGPVTASFDFPVHDRLDLVGGVSASLRVAPDGGVPRLSAALVEVTPNGATTTLKDQVAVTRVTRPGVIEFHLPAVEATLEPGSALRLELGLDDRRLAPNLTADRLPSPEELNEVYGPLVPADSPTTDGLYFDSSTDPASSLTVYHAGRGESTLSLTTVPSGRRDRTAASAVDRGSSRRVPAAAWVT